MIFGTLNWMIYAARWQSCFKIILGVSTVPYTVYGRIPQAVIRLRVYPYPYPYTGPKSLDGTGRGIYGRIRDVYGSQAGLVFAMHHACIIARRALCQAKLSRSIVLPAGRLRVLVALYHQSQSFVMPEKLGESIDRAFA